MLHHTDVAQEDLTEKYIIARANQNNLLNKRTELIPKRRHRNKYILINT